MNETDRYRLIHDKKMEERDLVKHHYNRRSFWGSDSMLYHRTHPMAWKKVSGTHQNWDIDASSIVPSDAESPNGEPLKLFYSEDLTVWLSRRRESMPYFFRNCDADELHVISQGRMTYETDFGVIEVQERDFLLIPKGITYRVFMDQPQDTLRLVYESEPEIFLMPAEMIEHAYGKGRPPLPTSKLQGPKLPTGPSPEGEFEVRVKYNGAFSDFMGEMSTLVYDHYPLDVEVIEGELQVFKFSVTDIERFPGTPVPFLAAAYLDNKDNLAFTLNLVSGLEGGGRDSSPVHRDADVDELKYCSWGPEMGKFEFTPHGVDHGWGRGYTKKERNPLREPAGLGDSISAYTVKPLKGTPVAQEYAKPGMD